MDCAGPSALGQLAKQLQHDDRRLHRDTYAAAAGSASRLAPQTVFRPSSHAAASEAQLVHEFLHGAPAMPTAALPPPPTTTTAIHHAPPAPWAHGDWAAEFRRDATTSTAMPPKLRELTDAEAAAFDAAFAQAAQSSVPAENWSTEFATQASTGPVFPVVPDDAELEAAFARHAEPANDTAWAAEFKGKQPATATPTTTHDNLWNHEFAQAQSDLAADSITQQFEALWQQDLLKNKDESEQLAYLSDPANWSNEFAQQLPAGNYTFEQDNPYLNHPDPASEAMRLRADGAGSLQQAALALEAAVQQNDTNARDAHLWHLLGDIQAENEKELPAIRALERAIDLAPNDLLPAYISLAVSYVNEGYDHQAFRTLEQWVRRRYPDLPIPDGAAAAMDVRRQVLDAYLIAARQGQAQGTHDPDVQIGLGVLLYSGGEYDKAVDCFSTALESRPDDYLLWNRLGATLANSGRSEDAIAAYHRALDIKPAFVRARFNLGVSCINIGCYQEAAQHLLSALAMHGDREGAANISSSLWDTLRRVLYMMDRRDLAELAKPGASLEPFHGTFDF